MSDVVKLVLPVDAAFRALAVELARKYAEIAGAGPDGVAQAAEAVTSGLAQAAAGGVSAAITFQHAAGQVAVRVEKSS
jgi:hypothetical protein